jgi:hypothetical protein
MELLIIWMSLAFCCLICLGPNILITILF